MRYFLGICAIVLCSESYGTLFLPLPIEDQLDRTDVVVHGTYHDSHGVERDSTGILLTEHSLNLFSAAGIETNEHSYRFLTLGGQQDGVVQTHEGAAHFQDGEEVVLLLRNTPHGSLMGNRSLSKYRVIQKEGEKYLVNSIFPDQEELSNFSLEHFNGLVERKFGSGLRRVEERQVLKKVKEGDCFRF